MSLLLDALRKAQDTRDRERGTVPAQPAQPAPPAAAPAATPREKRFVSPLVAVGLAIAVFVAVVSAWHSQPWRAPPHILIDPSQLKLDTHLDPARKGTPPPANTGTPPS